MTVLLLINMDLIIEMMVGTIRHANYRLLLGSTEYSMHMFVQLEAKTKLKKYSAGNASLK